MHVLTRRGLKTAVAGSVALAALLPALPASARGNDCSVNVLSTSRGLSLSTRYVHAGQLTFHFRSTVPETPDAGGSDVAIFRLKGKATLAQLEAEVQAQTSSPSAAAAASTRWLTTHVTIYGGASIAGVGTATDVVTLGAGTYTVLDLAAVFAEPTTHVAPTAKTLHVYGSVRPGLLPRIAGTIDTTSKDRFAVTSTTLARGAYLIRNVSDTIHFVDFQPVKPGTTDATMTAVAAAEMAGKQPPVDPYDDSKTSVEAEVLTPGHDQVFSSALLTPGTYDLECYIADDETGVPHFFMGMHKIVHIR